MSKKKLTIKKKPVELSPERLIGVECLKDYINPKKLEQALYEHSLNNEFQNKTYQNVCWALAVHSDRLKDRPEDTYRQLVTEKESDMDPRNWKFATVAKNEVNDIAGDKKVAATDLIRCKCGGKTILSEKQTRSCDEAMTVEALCVDCGKRFRA